MSMYGVSTDFVIDVLRVVVVPPSEAAVAPASLPAEVLVPSPLVALASALEPALTDIVPSSAVASTSVDVSTPVVAVPPSTPAVELELLLAEAVPGSALEALAVSGTLPAVEAAVPPVDFALPATAGVLAELTPVSCAGLLGTTPAIRVRPSAVDARRVPVL